MNTRDRKRAGIPSSFILGVEKHGIRITRDGALLGIGRTRKEIRAIAARGELRDTDIIMFSSSMDFPDEYTQDRQVLRMVKWLNEKSECKGV